MSEEKLEKYWNKVYYDYLEKEEAKELIDYYKNMEQENKQLKEALDTKFYCQYANKCNELYDCTREEYQTMTESNMKLSLILTELEEWFKKEKQIAEQNIIESKKWLEIEEQKLVAKSDIHTGKIIRRYMQYGLNKIQELKEKYK